MGDPQEVIADRILEMLIPGRNSSNSTLNVNAGGLGIWVAVAAVIVALVWGSGKDGAKAESLVALQAQATRQQQEIYDMRADIRELRATDNAVRAYINTGILKPKTEKDKTP